MKITITAAAACLWTLLAALLALPGLAHAQRIEYQLVIGGQVVPTENWFFYPLRNHELTAIDRSGNYYLTGTFRDSLLIANSVTKRPGLNHFIARLDTKGKALWVQTSATDGAGMTSVCLDSLGGVYFKYRFINTTTSFGGQSLTTGVQKRWSAALWKLDTMGEVKWGKLLATYKDTSGRLGNFTDVDGYRSPGSIGADRQGNTYHYLTYIDSIRIFDSTYSNPRTRSAVFLKLDKDGAMTWLRDMPHLDSEAMDIRSNDAGYYNEGQAMAITASGHAYLNVRAFEKIFFGTQALDGGHPQLRFNIVKVNPAGRALWNLCYARNIHSSMDPFTHLGTDAKENIYLLSGHGSGLEFRGLPLASHTQFFVKLDSAGDHLWHRGFTKEGNGSGGDLRYYNGLSVNGAGAFSITAAMRDTLYFDGRIFARKIKDASSVQSTFLASFETTGDLRWADIFEEGPNNTPLNAHVGRGGEVIAYGEFTNYIVPKDTLRVNVSGATKAHYLVKLSPSGIRTTSPGAESYCAGDTVHVNWIATHMAAPTNQYVFQLSDSSGNFNSNTRELGRVLAEDTSGSVSLLLPLDVPLNELYRIRVIGTDPILEASTPGPLFFILGAPPIKVTARKPTTFCRGGEVALDATGGARYLWSTGDTTSRIDVSESGTYFVQGFNSTGCFAWDSIVITVIEPPVATIEASGPLEFCKGGWVTLTANDAHTHAWSTGETTRSIKADKAGSYFVTVTNKEGCLAASEQITVSILDTPPVPTITRDGNVLTSSADEYNQWYYYSNPIEGATEKSYTMEKGGDYYVRVTYPNDCSTISLVERVLSDVAVSGDNASEPKIIGESITYSGTGKVRLEVLDILGREVMLLFDGVSSSDLRLPVPGSLTNGTYHVRAIRSDGSVVTRKLNVWR